MDIMSIADLVHVHQVECALLLNAGVQLKERDREENMEEQYAALATLRLVLSVFVMGKNLLDLRIYLILIPKDRQLSQLIANLANLIPRCLLATEGEGATAVLVRGQMAVGKLVIGQEGGSASKMMTKVNILELDGM